MIAQTAYEKIRRIYPERTFAEVLSDLNSAIRKFAEYTEVLQKSEFIDITDPEVTMFPLPDHFLSLITVRFHPSGQRTGIPAYVQTPEVIVITDLGRKQIDLIPSWVESIEIVYYAYPVPMENPTDEPDLPVGFRDIGYVMILRDYSSEGENPNMQHRLYSLDRQYKEAISKGIEYSVRNTTGRSIEVIEQGHFDSTLGGK